MDELRVKTSGADLHVWVSGMPDTAAGSILLLHGGPGAPGSMQDDIAPLLDGMHCVTFDQRGVGGSVCVDGRYELDDYVADIEAIRTQLGIDRWHVLGHSWGGLLAQVYAARRPERLSSLFLCNPGLGLGADWARTKKEMFRTDRERLGVLGLSKLMFYGSGMSLPWGSAKDWGIRHTMALAWKSYFLDPRQATTLAPAWLAGCSWQAWLETDKALARAGAHELDALTSLQVPAIVLFGDHDIFGSGAQIVRERLPAARQVELAGTGHLPWLQAPDDFRAVLSDFYSLPS